MGESEFERSWRHFLEVLDTGDDAAALEALNTWQRVWDRTFWAREFNGWDRVYEDDAELAVHTHIPGVYGGRGTRRWRELREEAAEVLRFSVWEATELHSAGERVLGLGRARARGRFTGLALRIPLHVLWTVRAGKIARVEFFDREREALQAAGLSR